MKEITRDDSDLPADGLYVRQTASEVITVVKRRTEILEEIDADAVYISTPRFTPGLLQILSDLKETRVYLMLSEKNELESAVNRNRVIRILDQPQNGAVLIAGSRSQNVFDAWIFPDERMEFGYRIPEKGAESKYLAFAKLFWTHCVEEYRNSTEAVSPMSLPVFPDFTNSDDFCVNGPAGLFNHSGCTEAYLGDVEDFKVVSAFEPSSVTFTLNSLKGNRIPEECAGINSNISESDNGGFSLALTRTYALILPRVFSASGVNWCCLVDEDMTQKFGKGYAHDWSYRRGRVMRDIIDQEVRSAEAPENVKLITERGEAGATVQCESIDSFLSEDSDLLHEKVSFGRTYSCHTTYILSFRPPLVPEGARKHNLHIRWKTAMEKWGVELESIREFFRNCVKQLGEDEYLSIGELNSINRECDTNISEVDELEQDALNLCTMSIEERNKICDRHKYVFAKSRAFERYCNQRMDDIKRRRERFEAREDGKASGIRNVGSAGGYVIRNFIDSFQDIMPGVDTNKFEKVEFPDPLPSVGTLYVFGSNTVLLALPRDAEKKVYTSDEVKEARERFKATLCSERS